MISLAKPFLRALLPEDAYRALADWWVIVTGGYARRSYAQEAEDLIAADLLGKTTPGFYVDIGAYHPVRFSNTYRFYRAGWRGLNIDAMPGSMTGFRRWRPRDINVEAAISSETRTITFHLFAEPALNTVSRELATTWATKHKLPYRTVDVPTRTLRDVLADNLPAGQTIDFLSLDVETHELDVLQSNDWSRFRPRCILVESLDHDPAVPLADPVHRFLADLGYRRAAATRRTLFYTDGQTATPAAAERHSP